MLSKLRSPRVLLAGDKSRCIFSYKTLVDACNMRGRTSKSSPMTRRIFIWQAASRQFSSMRGGQRRLNQGVILVVASVFSLLGTVIGTSFCSGQRAENTLGELGSPRYGTQADMTKVHSIRAPGTWNSSDTT